MPKHVSDAVFIETFKQYGPAGTSKRLDLNQRGVYSRRTRLEKKYRISLSSNDARATDRIEYTDYPQRIQLKVAGGCVIVAGDAHYCPGTISIMHKALVKFCKELKPQAIIFNGDILDAPTISRHARRGWEQKPDLADEIEHAKERLHEIEKAAGQARKIWNIGNHDERFENRVANVAPEYARIFGLSLRDHFPLWEIGWSTWINDDVVVKHRFKGGIHAPHNGTLWAGKTLITGHLHSAKVAPLTDYNGTRYGVDAGCLADPDHPNLWTYAEANPRNWRGGFCVLTFTNGRMLQPELVLEWDKRHIQFRGRVIGV